jgi:hypothetical protein
VKVILLAMNDCKSEEGVSGASLKFEKNLKDVETEE